MCSPATRGIWVDALCAMHENNRSGSITGSPDQLARVLRCTPAEFLIALRELGETKTADILWDGSGAMSQNVTPCPKKVTLINRRMRREFKDRNNAKLRKRRERG
jgi:hypothetical protein